MGRRRTFIESEAISSATAVFAERGFAGASVDDLVRATGVNRTSLYGVFGSKDGLFQRCLTETLAALSPTAAPGDSTGVARAGCGELDLILVALMEIAPGDPAVRASPPRRWADACWSGPALRRRARPQRPERHQPHRRRNPLQPRAHLLDHQLTSTQPTCPREEQTS